AWLAARGVRPNPVSLASVFFASAAGVCLALSGRGDGSGAGFLLLAAAILIPLRGLCNMLDGLIAIEEGLGSAVGAISNDLPDRIADSFILVGAGLATRMFSGGVTLGWVAALLAVLTAYVRVLGGSLGLPQSFAGPMAKTHRMAVVTLGCIASAVESFLGNPPRLLFAALAVIAVGCLVTIVRRVRAIALQLKAR